MPVPHLTQNQIGILPRVVDIVENRRAADFAGIVDYNRAKSEQPLQDGSRNSDILNLGEGNITCGPRNQTVVDLDLRIR